ncbi:MAG TPA: OmcA/MtrC family decaheme c-type cytochrome [Anaerolineaceae bacterium]
MKSRLVRWTVLAAIVVGVVFLFMGCNAQPGPAGAIGQQGLAGPVGPAGPTGIVGPSGSAGVAAPQNAALIIPGDGLLTKISKVVIPADNKPIVTLTITDTAGRPMQSKVLEGYGFTLAQILTDKTSGLSKYHSLLFHDVAGVPYPYNGETKQPALAKASQSFAETGGTWADNDDGTATYTFKNSLSSPADHQLTTVAGIYAYKDSRATVANDVYMFVPAGGTPSVGHQEVTTAACQGCHNPLVGHGGTRRTVELCLSCHTDQSTDPESGNTIDFKVLIHKLHDGSALPSVVAGTPYYFAGAKGATDFSTVTWPQDPRNCTTCHTGGAQSDAYKTSLSTAACTSCHDNVNLTTGDNHPGKAQSDDSKCVACHPAEGDEFDASITGGHTIPANSKQLKGVKLEIISIDAAKPGSLPVVTFKVSDNSGKSIAPADMDYLGFTLAGPTSDYVNRVIETAIKKPATKLQGIADAGNGAFKYTFQYKIPANATGTYAVGMEGYVMETIKGVKDPVRDAGFNPVAYTALDGGKADPRRQVVDRDKCDSCHKNLAVHGGNRQNTDYCVLCHNPATSDIANRPADKGAPQSISFRVMIHGLHSGAALEQQPFTVWGTGTTPADFSGIVFPGDLAACQSCHKAGTYALPLGKGIQPTTFSKDGITIVSSTLPDRSVCSSCHDSSDAQGHYELMTTPSGTETCSVCHGTGAAFDVNKVHH